jgi:hypothetical protein
MPRQVTTEEFADRLRMLGRPGRLLWLTGDDECHLVVSQGTAAGPLEQQARQAGSPFRRGVRIRLADGSSFVADPARLCTLAEMNARWYVVAPGGAVVAVFDDDEDGAWDHAAGRSRGYTTCRGHPSLGLDPAAPR